MKLNLGLLIDSLPTGFVQHEALIGEPDAIMSLGCAVPLFTGSKFDEDILYVTSWKTLSGIKVSLPRFVSCIGGGEKARDFFKKHDISGIIFPDCADMLIVLNALQLVFRKFEAFEHELLNVMLGDASTRTILNCCAEFFEGCIMLFNSYSSGFLLLDHSDNFVPPESNVFWNEVQTQNRIAFERNPREKAKILPKNPEKYPKSTFHESVNNFEPHFVTAFDYGDLRFASLIVMGVNKSLTSNQHWLVDYIADLISPVITRRYNSSLNVRNNARNALTTALHLARKNGRNMFNTAKDVLAQLRWSSDDDYRLMLVSLPPECHNVSHYLYNYERIFATSYFDCIALNYNDLIVFLLHGEACKITDHQLELIEQQLELDNGFCSIGNLFCEFSQLASHFDLTVLPIKQGPNEKRIRYYRDIMPAHIINTLDSVFPIKTVCNSAVVRLNNYDVTNGTTFLSTLEAYLMNNNSLIKTASQLYIHKNTMTYRLKCIEKIVEMDLNDPDERLGILLSCIIVRTLFK
ncbi:MAG: helix-turn-helix domain-containing protein [Oscillospiraceae bacterium]|nr:helix-turn-helix domain-containing protein [Oscillospiraceae bacterium]